MNYSDIKSPINPSGDKLVVFRLKPAAKIGSIYLADTAQERPSYGVLVAKGPNTKENFCLYSALVFSKYAGVEQEFSGIPFLIMKEDEVLGTIVDKSLLEKLEAATA